MIEVHYCVHSEFGHGRYASGSSRFRDATELANWLNEQLKHGPVLITDMRWMDQR